MPLRRTLLFLRGLLLLRRLLLLSGLLLLTGCALGQLDTRSALALHDRAESLYQQGDYPAALQLYRQLSQQFPREPEFQHRIGNCYAFDGNLEQAVIAYEAAIAVDPQYSRAWYNLSYVRAQMLAATVARMHDNIDATDPNALRMQKLVIDVLAPFGDTGVPLESSPPASAPTPNQPSTPPTSKDGAADSGATSELEPGPELESASESDHSAIDEVRQ